MTAAMKDMVEVRRRCSPSLRQIGVHRSPLVNCRLQPAARRLQVGNASKMRQPGQHQQLASRLHLEGGSLLLLVRAQSANSSPPKQGPETAESAPGARRQGRKVACKWFQILPAQAPTLIQTALHLSSVVLLQVHQRLQNEQMQLLLRMLRRRTSTWTPHRLPRRANYDLVAQPADLDMAVC